MTHSILPMPRADQRLIWAAAAIGMGLAVLPMVGSALLVDKLTYLFILIMFATMWNLLAGYAGLVSVVCRAICRDQERNPAGRHERRGG